MRKTMARSKYGIDLFRAIWCQFHLNSTKIRVIFIRKNGLAFWSAATHTGLFIAIWCGNLFGEKVTNFIISLIRGKFDHTEVNYERKNVFRLIASPLSFE